MTLDEFYQALFDALARYFPGATATFTTSRSPDQHIPCAEPTPEDGLSVLAEACVNFGCRA